LFYGFDFESYITWHELVNSDAGNLHRPNANVPCPKRTFMLAIKFSAT